METPQFGKTKYHQNKFFRHVETDMHRKSMKRKKKNKNLKTSFLLKAGETVDVLTTGSEKTSRDGRHQDCRTCGGQKSHNYDGATCTEPHGY